MVTVLMLGLFTYPLWGLAVLFLLCRRLAAHGSMTRRLAVAFVVAGLVMALFTLVTWGTEGFALFAPWPTALFEPKHSAFLWELAACVFVIAFVINLLSGRASPKTSVPRNAAHFRAGRVMRPCFLLPIHLRPPRRACLTPRPRRTTTP